MLLSASSNSMVFRATLWHLLCHHKPGSLRDYHLDTHSWCGFPPETREHSVLILLLLFHVTIPHPLLWLLKVKPKNGLQLVGSMRALTTRQEDYDEDKKNALT